MPHAVCVACTDLLLCLCAVMSCHAALCALSCHAIPCVCVCIKQQQQHHQQADQEEDFDIMDDVLLMADDPNMPGGAGAGGGDEADESIGNPAAGLSIDSFMGASMLPGAGSSELGQAYLDDVLAPAGAGDEELEEELME